MKGTCPTLFLVYSYFLSLFFLVFGKSAIKTDHDVCSCVYKIIELNFLAHPWDCNLLWAEVKPWLLREKKDSKKRTKKRQLENLTQLDQALAMQKDCTKKTNRICVPIMIMHRNSLLLLLPASLNNTHLTMPQQWLAWPYMTQIFDLRSRSLVKETHEHLRPNHWQEMYIPQDFCRPLNSSKCKDLVHWWDSYKC